MKTTYLLAVCLALRTATASCAPASAPRYSQTARDEVLAAMIATAQQLQPVPRPALADREDTRYGGKEDTYERLIFAQRDFLAGMARLGDNEAAWQTAQRLGLDKIRAGHFDGSVMPITFAHAAALHWVAAGDIPRALAITDTFTTPAWKARERLLNSDDLPSTNSADVWLNAANRLVRLEKPALARQLLARAAVVIRERDNLAARGYLAWLLKEAGDDQGSVREFAEARRRFELAAKRPAWPRRDSDTPAWLAVWHLRAGHILEAAEIAGPSRAYQVAFYLDGKTQHVGSQGDPPSNFSAATAPYARILLDRADSAVKAGDTAMARRLLQGADAFISFVNPGLADITKAAEASQLHLRAADIYDAVGDAGQAAKQRSLAKRFDALMQLGDDNAQTIEEQESAKQQTYRTLPLLQDAAWGKNNPKTLGVAVTAATARLREVVSSPNPNTILPSLALTEALFRHGFDAEARETAHAAIDRAMTKNIHILELSQAEATARILWEHSDAGSPDQLLAEKLVAKIRSQAAAPNAYFVYPTGLAMAGWLDEAIVVSRIQPGDEEGLASIWAQKRGAHDSLLWVKQIKSPTHRANAMAAISAALAAQRDSDLPEPFYRWIDDRTSHIQRVQQ